MNKYYLENLNFHKLNHNQFNDKRERNGYWEESYFNGVTQFRGNYINGQMIGYWEVFDIFGQITDKVFLL
jgi:hypothetical protein